MARSYLRHPDPTPAQRTRIVEALKVKPLPRGKAKDAYALSAPGAAHGHFWEGAVRSGKTVGSLLRWIRFVLDGPPGNLAMIGKTERSLKRNAIDWIVALLGPKRARLVQGSGELHLCGRLIYLVGANDEGAVARIQGMTLVGFYGDEMPTWPKAVFDMARTRLSEPGAEWFGTGNPASKTHHLNLEWIEKAKLHLRRDGTIIRREGPDARNVHVYSFTIYDNPFLTADFVRTLESSYTGVFYKRYILGEWCIAEGAIYDAWDPDRHVLQLADVPPIERWVGAGIDHGVASPFHAVLIGLGPAPRGERGKALYLTSEYRYDPRLSGRRLADLEYARNVVRWLRDVPQPGTGGLTGVEPEMLVVDSAAQGFRTTLFGIGVPSWDADKEVLPGIASMASLIADGKFYACGDTAPAFCDEVPAYSWDDKKAQLGIDAPVKAMDHGLDGGRYVIQTGRQFFWDELYAPGEELVGSH